ncbi:hypothetical protein [Hymenobacter properus]|uniref:Uncharacterized protein n=1 Tax=Hymenobacter properus TaxID=2791026 RepID=A0A931BBQ2_9BACT|nr:hypothetical protein [Hymenobacter properus]MBF9140814.1 hypothetical protein [Hymenobacter properus]MBR7719623.1 hypothetical protein [Microvirga sp. SRT04]
MTPAQLASWLLAHLDTDVWLTEATLSRRLAGIQHHHFTAPGLLGAVKRAGWVEQHPAYADTFCIASRCWLPKPKKT